VVMTEKVRAATAEDFAFFRVMLPKDL
jgi:hypothetical protein